MARSDSDGSTHHRHIIGSYHFTAARDDFFGKNGPFGVWHVRADWSPAREHASRVIDGLGHADTLAEAWKLAGVHVVVIETTGNCKGRILIRAVVDGKIHQARFDQMSATCGMPLAGLASEFRISGSGVDRAKISCVRCFMQARDASGVWTPSGYGYDKR
jgi:hypothetical protein